MFPCSSSGSFHPSTTVIRNVRQSLSVKHTERLVCYNSSKKPTRVLLFQTSLFQKTLRHQERTPSKLNCFLTNSSPKTFQFKANHTIYITLSIFHLYFQMLPSPRVPSPINRIQHLKQDTITHPPTVQWSTLFPFQL